MNSSEFSLSFYSLNYMLDKRKKKPKISAFRKAHYTTYANTKCSI